MNQIQCIGRLARNNNVTALKNGSCMVRNVIAVPRYAGSKQTRTDFLPFVAWNGTAKFIRDYLNKGDELAIVGYLESGQYTNKNGEEIYTLEINVREVSALRPKRQDNSDRDRPIQEIDVEIAKE